MNELLTWCAREIYTSVKVLLLPEMSYNKVTTRFKRLAMEVF